MVFRRGLIQKEDGDILFLKRMAEKKNGEKVHTSEISKRSIATANKINDTYIIIG